MSLWWFGYITWYSWLQVREIVQVGVNWLYELLKTESFLWQVTEKEMREIQSMRCTWQAFAGFERSPWEGKQVSSKSREWPPAYSQPGKGDVTLTTGRNWLLPPTWMSLEANFSADSPGENSSQKTLITALSYPKWRLTPHPTRFLTYKIVS